MYHLMADLTAATIFLTIVLIVNDDFLANFVAVFKFRLPGQIIREEESPGLFLSSRFQSLRPANRAALSIFVFSRVHLPIMRN